MGLFDFWNGSRPSVEQDALKGQAYDSTTAALPPTMGNMPVTGNGPNTLECLAQVATKRSQGQLSNASAPASSILRTTFSIVSSRPKSAVSRTKSVSRTDSRGQGVEDETSSLKIPPSPNSAKKYGPYRIYKDDDAPPTPRIPEHFARAPSVESNASKRKSNYMDLLDIQSGIRAVDFHSRVQAAGARNYGEDVAERNLTMYTPPVVTSSAAAPTSTLTSAPAPTSTAVPSIRNGETHQFKRVSVIPEDAEEAREQKVALKKVLKPPPVDASPGKVIKQRQSFGEITTDNSTRRSKPPASLTFRPVTANYEEVPDFDESLESRHVAAEYEDEQQQQQQQQGRRDDAKLPAAQSRRREQRPRTATSTRSKGRHAARGKTGAFAQHNGVGYDTTEDEDFSSPAPSPKISRHADSVVADPPAKTSQGGWKRTHGPTYRELVNSASRPSSAHGGKYPQRAHSLTPSAHATHQSSTVIQPPNRSSSLVPRPAAPVSPTTVSSMQSSHLPHSPPKSQYTTATSVDEQEHVSPSAFNDRAPEKSRNGSIRLRDREGDRVSGASFVGVPEEQRYSTHRLSFPRSGHGRRDTLGSHATVTDDTLTTDGSDFEAYLARRHARRRQEDAALQWYEENGLAEVGKSLPGLFDGLSSPTISNWSGPQTPRLPTAERLSTLLASRYHKDPTSASRKAYTAHLAKALLDQYAEDYESEAGLSEWDAHEDVGGGSSRNKAIRLLAMMKEQGLNIVDLLDMEESLKERERQDARMAMRLRKEMKKLERLERGSNGGGSFDAGDKLRGKRPQRALRMDMRSAIPEY